MAVDRETGLITAPELIPANESDGSTELELLEDPEPGLQVLVDCAYGKTRAELLQKVHDQAIKPISLACPESKRVSRARRFHSRPFGSRPIRRYRG